MYLVSPQQGGASVHVVLRLEDVNHLVRVELEHALHFLLLQGLLPALAGLLVQLLPALLVLPDPSQVPGGQKGKDQRNETRRDGITASQSMETTHVRTLRAGDSLTWGERQASEQGAPSTQAMWNLGLSSGQHNQTNAAHTKQRDTG